MSADLLALAERCEREEPSFDLDLAIQNAVGHDNIFYGSPNGDLSDESDYGPNHYTGSLDAAVTLVPEECGMDTSRYWLRKPASAVYAVSLLWGTKGENVEVLDCTSLPRAICAAALRARAAIALPHPPVSP